MWKGLLSCWHSVQAPLQLLYGNQKNKQLQRRVFPMTLLKPAQIDKAYSFIKFQKCCVVAMVSQIICEETLLEKQSSYSVTSCVLYCHLQNCEIKIQINNNGGDSWQLFLHTPPPQHLTQLIFGITPHAFSGPVHPSLLQTHER